MAFNESGNWENDTFRKVRLKNDDETVLNTISDQEYLDFLDILFAKAIHQEGLKQKLFLCLFNIASISVSKVSLI